LQESDYGADEIQRLVSMNPVTGIWDVLDISTRKKSQDFRVILRAKRVTKGSMAEKQTQT